MRPDFGRINRQQRFIAETVGETASWKVFVSAAGGTPQAGVQNVPSYETRTITALFRLPPFDENQVPGGQYIAGDVLATLEHIPGSQDYIQWRGVQYRIEGDPVPERLTSAYTVLLRRGQG